MALAISIHWLDEEVDEVRWCFIWLLSAGGSGVGSFKKTSITPSRKTSPVAMTNPAALFGLTGIVIHVPMCKSKETFTKAMFTKGPIAIPIVREVDTKVKINFCCAIGTAVAT